MNGLKGLAWLLVFQCAGEVISRSAGLPVPGPVVGLLLLFGGLFHARLRLPVGTCAGLLLSNLSLLFIPVGVGVMTHLALLHASGLRILVVIVLSTWIGMGVTVLTLHALRDRPETEPADA